MFCVQLYGKWTHWGCYNLYFEAFKGLLLKKNKNKNKKKKKTKKFKNTPIFYLIFAENVKLLSLNIVKADSLGPLPQSIKSPLSPSLLHRPL